MLQNSESDLVLPGIAYAEACWIIEHRRIPVLTVARLQTAIANDPRISFHPLDRTVIDRSHTLTTIHEMHDRQIVATALVLADGSEEVALLTRDENIIASGLIPVIW